MADEDDAAGVEVSESTDAEEPADEPADESGDEATEATEAPNRRREPGVRPAVVIGAVVVLALAGLGGWLGFRAYDAHKAQQQRDLFLEVGREAGKNLTSIGFTEADADVQRILDSATGSFYDDFQKRAPAFIDVVKQAQAKSEGTVTEAGLEEPDDANHGKVLVAVTVRTSNAGTPEQLRAFRMRITVEKTGDGAKVSRVEYIP